MSDSYVSEGGTAKANQVWEVAVIEQPLCLYPGQVEHQDFKRQARVCIPI